MRLSLIQSGVIAHQCNCLGFMGCGAALAIRQLHPRAYERYRPFGHRTGDGTLQLGMVQLVRITPSLQVANLMAQFGISRQVRMTDYEALETCLSKLQSRIGSDAEIYFPHRMGCANAGGDWSVVRPLIEKYFPDARYFERS